MKMKIIALFAALFLFSFAAHAGQLPPCTTGQTTCSNDTTNDAGLVVSMQDQNVQSRVFGLWIDQCNSVYAEAATTTGHVQRVNMCLAIAAGRLPPTLLVALILSPTVQTEILDGQGPPASGYQPAGGNMVDADVNFAIAAALAVTKTEAVTTATATIPTVTVGSATFQVPTVGITVASATGIVIGQSVFANGVAPDTVTTRIDGTTVYLSKPIVGSMSSTPISFQLLTGLPTRNW